MALLLAGRNDPISQEVKQVPIWYKLHPHNEPRRTVFDDSREPGALEIPRRTQSAVFVELLMINCWSPCSYECHPESDKHAMITIHLISHAHLDPIWLWPWQAGLDEALATCRSACDRLDANPDLFFSQGEAWVYQQVERTDPALFEQMRSHIEAGRWEIVGGWWIQPDCNLPTGMGMQRQIELGKQYLLDRFGTFPAIGFNVDSFGHAATLPDLMHRAGQHGYIMMRPQEHELPLPSRLFRWRGHEEGPELVTFRIAQSYTTRDMNLDHVRAALDGLPAGIEHTMALVGIGDHGGGPSEQQIAWIREHEHSIEGARLVFSTTQHFFEAIAPYRDALPLVTGELQHHAIGCYSVQRSTKVALRRAEHLLAQAERVLDDDPNPEPLSAERMTLGWQSVCFHQFHDTLGGTCLPSAYRQVDDDLGGAAATGDRLIHTGLRRLLNDLPDDPCQRLVWYNASAVEFDGFLECEPWLEWSPWDPNWRLVDERGENVGYQLMASEALMDGLGRLVVKQKISPGQIRVLRIDRAASHGRSASPDRPAGTKGTGTIVGAGTEVCLDQEHPSMRLGELPLPLPRLDLIADHTDTWSHNVDRYGRAPIAPACFDRPVIQDHGPWLASLVQVGIVGESEACMHWRAYADASHVDLLLRVHWKAKHRLLKLTLALPDRLVRSDDGIMGGHLTREPTGAERPLQDWTLAHLANGRRLGVVCPDVYALDATSAALRFTLLRSPLMAHHEPHPGNPAGGVFADQGVHTFRFRLLPDATAVQLAAHALQLQQPPLYADLTRGMPTVKKV